MRVIVAGGRDFKDYDYLSKSLDIICCHIPFTEVVSGKQKTYDKKLKVFYGADYLGERWAISKNIKVVGFQAEWKKYGRPAGPKRNMEMAKYADLLIAFWDGSSSGTRNMVECMKGLNKEYIVIRY